MENLKKSGFPRERQARWDSRNLVTVSTHLRPADLQDFKQACLVAGRSAYSVLQESIRAFVRDNLGPPLSPA